MVTTCPACGIELDRLDNALMLAREAIREVKEMLP